MRRSMDAVRFLPGTEDNESNGFVDKDAIIKLECKRCGQGTSIKVSEIEDYIESDSHDPDIEYLVCPHCDSSYDITNFHVNVLLEQNGATYYGKVESDGYFTYFNINNESYRLN